VGEEAVLTVRNPVPPGAPAPSDGYGLTGMAERAALVGGDVTARRDGTFFVVRATVPA
jgi:signal transduction histidine kinase